MNLLKQQILNLKSEGMTQSEIAKMLNCSTGTVSYHCNPKVKEKIIRKKRIRNQILRNSNVYPYLDAELNIKPKEVCWKHAEAISVAKLIEKGYEVFTPFNGGGEIDLIAYKDNNLFRIQVKSISPTSSNFVNIKLTRNSINYKRHKSTSYTNIDFFLIYDGYNVYKIDEKVDNITLRYTVPSNGQIDFIRMASNYIF